MPLWSRKKQMPKEGEFYRRRFANGSSEIAEVMSITADRLGIAHVRYRIEQAHLGPRNLKDERRTLALAAFAEQYPERLGQKPEE